MFMNLKPNSCCLIPNHKSLTTGLDERTALQTKDIRMDSDASHVQTLSSFVSRLSSLVFRLKQVYASINGYEPRMLRVDSIPSLLDFYGTRCFTAFHHDFALEFK